MIIFIKPDQPVSTIHKNTPVIATITRTTPTCLNVCSLDGQVTFLNSALTSVRNFLNLLNIYRLKVYVLRQCLLETGWQARRDSNPQPPVLETDALPIGATGLHLFDLFMNGVFAVKSTVLLDFHFGRFYFLVARRAVVLSLALGTLQMDDISHCFLFALEPGSRIELPTSSLPRKRSTTELPGLWIALRKVCGGERRIRTSEGGADRFTVCSLWPLGNLPVKNWCWLEDSNSRPADYKSAALPTELSQHFDVKYSI